MLHACTIAQIPFIALLWAWCAPLTAVTAFLLAWRASLTAVTLRGHCKQMSRLSLIAAVKEGDVAAMRSLLEEGANKEAEDLVRVVTVNTA